MTAIAGTSAAGFEAVAWIAGIPGLVLSIWTGVAYVPQVRRAVAAASGVNSRG